MVVVAVAVEVVMTAGAETEAEMIEMTHSTLGLQITATVEEIPVNHTEDNTEEITEAIMIEAVVDHHRTIAIVMGMEMVGTYHQPRITHMVGMVVTVEVPRENMGTVLWEAMAVHPQGVMVLVM